MVTKSMEHLAWGLLPLLLFAGTPAGAAPATQLEKATFAGGCFWCMEPPFEKLPGVASVMPGYMGGEGKNPTYQDYARKGHLEVVQITYDPAKVTYERLLEVFWRQIDPTDGGGQFVDRGEAYTTAIFFHDEHQRKAAEQSKKALEDSKQFDRPIVTAIRAASTFYAAEDYHRDYYAKNPLRYKMYRAGSGRDQFLQKAWKDGAKPVEKQTSPPADKKAPELNK